MGTLADNGGPTMSIMPQSGSVAIGLGGPFCQTVDQRGYVRSGPCDAGAVQASASIPDEIFSSGFDP